MFVVYSKRETANGQIKAFYAFLLYIMYVRPIHYIKRAAKMIFRGAKVQR